MQIFLGPVSSWTSTSSNFYSVKIQHFCIVFCPALNLSFKIFPLFCLLHKNVEGVYFHRTFNNIFPCCRLFESNANEHPLFNRLHSSHTLSTHYLWLVTHDQVLQWSSIAKSLNPSTPTSVQGSPILHMLPNSVHCMIMNTFIGTAVKSPFNKHKNNEISVKNIFVWIHQFSTYPYIKMLHFNELQFDEKFSLTE
jgi:hypothetical protein